MIPLEVKVLASGSKGNCIYIGSGNSHVLIDVGVPKTKIEKTLLENGIDPTKLDAIFITHAHKDHVQGLPLANKYKIWVSASEGTWKTIKSMVDEDLHNVGGLLIGGSCDDDGWLEVTPFKTHHDDYDSNGYTITNGKTKVSVCLDTGHVDQEMLDAMTGSDIYIIEANHEPAMVDVSSYPDSVKARILSDIGHLSNEQCADALAKLVQGKGERIILTHLSSNNNDRDLAAMTVASELMKKGLKDGEQYTIEVI
jgi:phosphoribosyl 1,2-cyclic phosphodiesterase